MVLMAAPFIGGLGSVALLVLALIGRTSKELGPLQVKRNDWLKRLLSREDREKAIRLFGDHNSQEYQQMIDERIAFLTPLLGDEFQKYLIK
jgi:hypothetical protein